VNTKFSAPFILLAISNIKFISKLVNEVIFGEINDFLIILKLLLEPYLISSRSIVFSIQAPKNTWHIKQNIILT